MLGCAYKKIITVWSCFFFQFFFFRLRFFVSWFFLFFLVFFFLHFFFLFLSSLFNFLQSPFLPFFPPSVVPSSFFTVSAVCACVYCVDSVCVFFFLTRARRAFGVLLFPFCKDHGSSCWALADSLGFSLLFFVSLTLCLPMGWVLFCVITSNYFFVITYEHDGGFVFALWTGPDSQ